MKEITRFRRDYLADLEGEFDELSAEDLELWVWCKVASAIDKAYKIGLKRSQKGEKKK